MKTDQEILESNAHISTEEIEKDILDTQADIARWEIEAQHLESPPR